MKFSFTIKGRKVTITNRLALYAIFFTLILITVLLAIVWIPWHLVLRYAMGRIGFIRPGRTAEGKWCFSIMFDQDSFKALDDVLAEEVEAFLALYPPHTGDDQETIKISSEGLFWEISLELPWRWRVRREEAFYTHPKLVLRAISSDTSLQNVMQPLSPDRSWSGVMHNDTDTIIFACTSSAGGLPWY